MLFGLADLLFQLNINDYQGVRSLQLIIQDMQISRRQAEACRLAEARLQEILEGGPIAPEEDLVPTREDIAAVFTVLRNDARLGNATISERSLLERTNAGRATASVGVIKLRLILRILTEMGVCAVRGPSEGLYLFEVHFDAPKTTIDASPLMQSLRRQVGDR